MPTCKALPSQTKLSELLIYEPDTGLLRWKFRPSGSSQWNGKYAGKATGGISKSTGRLVVRLDGSLYLAHRIAWKMVTGNEPIDIDHKDGDPTNNRWSNLREATDHQNLRNSKLHHGKLLPKGVSHDKSGGYRASIYLNGRCTHLGVFHTPEGAHEAYKSKAAEAFGEFARFS